MAKNDKDSVRYELGRNNNLYESVQLILTKFCDRVIDNLSYNHNISGATQLILAKNNRYAVRYYLALNPNISIETQLVLVEDKDYRVRIGLASNYNVSIKIRSILQKDENYYVTRQNRLISRGIRTMRDKRVVNGLNTNK